MHCLQRHSYSRGKLPRMKVVVARRKLGDQGRKQLGMFSTWQKVRLLVRWWYDACILNNDDDNNKRGSMPGRKWIPYGVFTGFLWDPDNLHKRKRERKADTRKNV